MGARPERSATLQPTDAYAELAFAALAHLPVRPSRSGGAGAAASAAAASITDARWLAWAAEAVPAAVREPLARDADAVSASLAAAGAAAVMALHALPALHRDLGQFEATSRMELGTLNAARVADGKVLHVLRAVPAMPLELLRCGMLLAAPGWRRAWPEVQRELELARAACEPSFVSARLLSPRLAAQPVELSHALGAHGRAIGGRVWVGAPLAWNDHGPDDAALWALHEVAVTAAAEVRAAGASAEDAAARWRGEEAVAIRSVTALVAGTRLATAHARWLARLSLGALPEPSTAEVAATLAALRA